MSTAVAPQAANKTKKRSGVMRYLQLLMFLGIIAAIYISFAGNVLSTSPGLPAEVGHFSLSHVETGDAALAEIRAIYGEDISYSMAFVAHYKGESGGLTIRAGEKREISDAEGAVNAIIGGMQKGEKKDYGDLKRIDVEGRTAYALKVKGMPYYLYQYGNRVMWVDIMEGDPNLVLAEVIRAYK
ncbi:MAG: hypothetical protein M1358_02985 [Chloroflexi bacterium]|nr:hypothetical protein [Chloroflexota bacterium]